MDKTTLGRFYSIHSMLIQAIDNDLVRELLREHCTLVMEAVEFYEKEVGKDCKFYQMGIKQMALDIAGWESTLCKEAVRLLRQANKTLQSSAVV